MLRFRLFRAITRARLRLRHLVMRCCSAVTDDLEMNRAKDHRRTVSLLLGRPSVSREHFNSLCFYQLINEINRASRVKTCAHLWRRLSATINRTLAKRSVDHRRMVAPVISERDRIPSNEFTPSGLAWQRNGSSVDGLSREADKSLGRFKHII